MRSTGPVYHQSGSSISSTPINNWIKIDNYKFNIISGEAQLSLGSHADITVKLDIKNNQSYYTYFIKKYELQSQGVSNNLAVDKIKFDIHHRSFRAIGTLIKSIDINFDDEMNITFVCDYLMDKGIQEIRDDTIDDILN